MNSNDISWEFFTNSKLYILDGTEYWVFDGTTCAAVTAAAGADKEMYEAYAEVKECLLWVTPLHPNYLYFSEIGDPANFLRRLLTIMTY